MNKYECEEILLKANKLIGNKVIITRGHSPKFKHKINCRLLKVACLCFKESGGKEMCQPKAFLEDTTNGEHFTWPLDLVLSENN